MPRNKTRAIEDIDISIALANFWISPLIDQCKLNDIEVTPFPFFLTQIIISFTILVKNSIRFRDLIMIEISIRSWKRDVIIKVITPRLSLRVEIYIPHTVTASIPNISKTSMFR